MISPAQLYRLRHRWLAHKQTFHPKPSGGSRRSLWPAEAVAYLHDILPHCQPLNFALLSDELARRFAFHRSRPAVAYYVRRHFPKLVPSQKPGPKPRRRWQCATIGELWQHDSSPHPWWPAERYPTLILTIDDHSRKILAATFSPSDTTWSHFQHLPPTPPQLRLHHRTQRPDLPGHSGRPAIRHHRPSSPPALLGHSPSTFHPSHRLALYPGKPHPIKSFSFCSDIFSHFELSPTWGDIFIAFLRGGVSLHDP